MRGIFWVLLFTTFGALAMPATIDAQEKKSPADKDSYTDKMTVKQWNGAKFFMPVEDVPAFRTEIKGKPVIYTKPSSDTAKSPKGSEITDKDGVVWVVTESKPGSGYQLNYVTKKEDKMP